MTKADLVDLIYERVGSSKKEAGDVVEAIFDIIKEQRPVLQAQSGFERAGGQR